MEDNTVVHFFKVNDTNYANFDLVPIMKVAYMLLDITQRSDPPNKLIVVIDCKGVRKSKINCHKIHISLIYYRLE